MKPLGYLAFATSIVAHAAFYMTARQWAAALISGAIIVLAYDSYMRQRR